MGLFEEALKKEMEKVKAELDRRVQVLLYGPPDELKELAREIREKRMTRWQVEFVIETSGGVSEEEVSEILEDFLTEQVDEKPDSIFERYNMFAVEELDD